MKPIPFPGNIFGLHVEFHRAKEGPDYFVFLYKNVCRMINTIEPKQVSALLGVARNTTTGKALREWAEEMINKRLPKPDAGKDTSFASDALQEALEDPTANTKMIT